MKNNYIYNIFVFCNICILYLGLIYLLYITYYNLIPQIIPQITPQIIKEKFVDTYSRKFAKITNETNIYTYYTSTNSRKNINTSSILIYTNNINNSTWINANIDTNIQALYRQILNNTIWTNISKSLNANNTSKLVDSTVSKYAQFPISYVCVICDTYEFAQIKNVDSDMIYNKITAPQGYFVAFTTPQKAMNINCSLDLAGKSIGYFGHGDEVFIDAILHGHRIDTNSVNKVLINDSELNLIEGYINKTDIFITYIIPGSDFHKLLLKQYITFIGFSNMDIARVALFYPGLTMQENVNISKTLLGLPPPYNNSNNRATVTQSENITNLPTMTQLFIMFKLPKIETFITRLDLPETYLDPTYSCYGDINTNIKALCDSAYDIVGREKTRNTTWDHPCVNNSDCPFFQANKNYPNNRGGCKDSGVCELPIGVRRISYRKYDDKNRFAPYCYGCDPYDTTCCANKTSPDYAFENDTNIRMNADANLPISIPLYSDVIQ